MALALLVALGMPAADRQRPALLMAFFPALLAVTFYSGAIPAVIGWLFAICAAAFAWGGSLERPDADGRRTAGRCWRSRSRRL